MVGCDQNPFDVESESELMRAITVRVGEDWASALRGCLPMLVALMHSHCNRPVSQLRHQVWQIVVERMDVDEGGDVQHHNPRLLDQQADMLVEELESIRLRRLERGDWSKLPCPPIMFG